MYSNLYGIQQIKWFSFHVGAVDCRRKKKRCTKLRHEKFHVENKQTISGHTTIVMYKMHASKQVNYNIQNTTYTYDNNGSVAMHSMHNYGEFSVNIVVIVLNDSVAPKAKETHTTKMQKKTNATTIMKKIELNLTNQNANCVKYE